MLRLLVVFLCLIVAFGEPLAQALTATTGSKNSTTAAPTIKTTTALTNKTTAASTNKTTTASTNVTTTASTNKTTTPTPSTNKTTTPTPSTNKTTTPTPSTNETTTPSNKTTTPTPTPSTNETTTPSTNKTTTLTSTPSTNETTTPSTNKTTTAQTTTTPKTTTSPPYGTYSIEEDGKYCLLAQFEAVFTIHYMSGPEGNKKKEAVGTVVLNRSAQVNASGDCGRLVLTWIKPEPYYILTIEFAKSKALQASNESSFTWRLSSVSFLANLTDNPLFKNATVKMVNASHTVPANTSINGGNGSYYYCKAEKQFQLQTDEKNYTVEADFSDWKVEPFVKKSSKDFGSGTECYQDKPTPTSTPKPKGSNDIVPIAVGCALAGLVLIVLIAYVIGRRKSHRGYEKV